MKAGSIQSTWLETETRCWKIIPAKLQTYDQGQQIFLTLTNRTFCLLVILELEKLSFVQRFFAIGPPITCSVKEKTHNWISKSLFSLSWGCWTSQLIKNSIFENCWIVQNIQQPFPMRMKFGTTFDKIQIKFLWFLMDLMNILAELKLITMTFCTETRGKKTECLFIPCSRTYYLEKFSLVPQC